MIATLGKLTSGNAAKLGILNQIYVGYINWFIASVQVLDLIFQAICIARRWSWHALFSQEHQALAVKHRQAAAVHLQQLNEAVQGYGSHIRRFIDLAQGSGKIGEHFQLVFLLHDLGFASFPDR